MEEAQSHPPSDDDRSAKTAEALRTLRRQADNALETHRQRVGRIESELNRCVQQIAEELARDSAASEVAAESAAEQLAALEWLQERFAEKESEATALSAQLTSQSNEYESQLAQREHDLDELREQVKCDRVELQKQLEERQCELEELRSQQCGDCEAARRDLANSNQKLREAHRQLEEAEANNGKATELLQAAEQRILELNKCAEYGEQLQQTQRKFELALADVHKLKKENTELHEELVRRPEPDEKESPELVSLRTERDALAVRLAELEQAADQPVDADVQQQMADLQQRFEMAVDDVRQLKQQNADLQNRLDANSGNAGGPEVDAGMDWKAQKARLLASLDAEDGQENSAERSEERTTIEGAISITDRVVAEKDAELAEQEKQIAQLRAELGTKPVEQDLDEVKRSLQAEVLDEDEIVQAERARLKQLQKEMQDKLREAELEISVQRATLAREQAVLEEKLSELGTTEAESPTSADGTPRRRWLSALGLRDDDDE